MARRTTSRRSSKRKSKSNAGAIIGGTLLLLVSGSVASAIGYFYYQASNREAIDPKTNCPVNGPKEIKALLIDTTDPITEKTLIDARNKFKAEASSTIQHGLIEIYGLTEQAGKLELMFSGCNPGDKNTVDDWTGNKRLQQRKWDEAFGKPLEEIEGKIDQGQGGNQSPIMAGIQNIKLRAFDQYKDLDVPKELIVMSDMIEHTPLYSQYKLGLEYETYRKSPAYRDFRTNLEGVDFSVWYIDRGIERFSGLEHMEFWANWVSDNNGNWSRAIKLEGVNAQVGGNS